MCVTFTSDLRHSGVTFKFPPPFHETITQKITKISHNLKQSFARIFFSFFSAQRVRAILWKSSAKLEISELSREKRGDTRREVNKQRAHTYDGREFLHVCDATSAPMRRKQRIACMCTSKEIKKRSSSTRTHTCTIYYKTKMYKNEDT